MNPKVFLSYSNNDRDFADRLFSKVQELDASLFLDSLNLSPGEHILSAMRSRIAAADVLVLLLSPHALESQWVQRELEYAVSKELRQRSITIVLLKVRPCRVPQYLQSSTIIDATRDFDRAVAKLASLLKTASLVQFEHLEPERFEALIGDLLRAYGFKQVRASLGSMDSEFDFSAQSVQRDPFGRSETIDWLIEVKAMQRPTDFSSLRSFLGALSLRKERGLFVTSGQLTSPARELLEHVARTGGPRISLVEGPEVKRLVMAKPHLVAKYFGKRGEI